VIGRGIREGTAEESGGEMAGDSGGESHEAINGESGRESNGAIDGEIGGEMGREIDEERPGHIGGKRAERVRSRATVGSMEKWEGKIGGESDKGISRVIDRKALKASVERVTESWRKD